MNRNLQTGMISKQLKNSTIVEIDKNANLMTQSQDIIIINYNRVGVF